MTDIHGAAGPARLSIGQSTVDGVRVVTLRGEIDHSIRDRFHQALIPPCDAMSPRTVADLSGVTFMDSSGINVLIAAQQAAEKADGWLRLAGPQATVLRVMRLVGIDVLIPCYPTLRHALAN
ncbi:STAS domain-containing protein [Streptomyces phyllanthi]|uniref:STAS domain-containing protein n=1 Tax=Streptomyces phyllanthi TaxID=1803180 RepID=UPI002AD372CF|nr:STAS domain-containing protein [Streptomyces phyllanthi]